MIGASWLGQDGQAHWEGRDGWDGGGGQDASEVAFARENGPCVEFA